MPKEFGAWPTVYNRFRQWRDAGVFESLLEGLIAEAAKRGEVDLSLVSIASTIARSPRRCRDAPGRRRPRRRPQVPPAGVRPDRRPGHGQPADSPQFIPVLGKTRVLGPVGRPRTRPDTVAGDKAYPSRGNRAHLRQRGIRAVIPEKRNRGRQPEEEGAGPVSHDAALYLERNTVERLINKLKAWRGIATRYDKSPDSYLAGLHLRASMIWIKGLTRTAQ